MQGDAARPRSGTVMVSCTRRCLVQLWLSHGRKRDLAVASSDAIDAGADGAKLRLDLLVAAIDVVDAVNPGGVIRDQSSEDEARARPQVRGGDRRSGQRSRARHDCKIAFNGDIRSHAHHFDRMQKAILEDRLTDLRNAVRLRCKGHELRLHVGGESWIFGGRYIGGRELFRATNADGMVALALNFDAAPPEFVN